MSNEKAEWNDRNESGVLPVEYKVLCKVDPTESTTRGGIHIPSHIQDKEKRERCVVTLVAAGGTAFTDPDWGDPTPRVGDRVRVSKYAGDLFKGADGCEYICLVDKNIEGIVTNEAEKDYSPSDQPDLAGDGIYASLRSQ